MSGSPSNCRNRLMAEGKPYPRSGCEVCKSGGLTGCPYEKAVHAAPVIETPIVTDKAFDRTYIPLPGGWEVQTKGKGSTFRLCGPDGERLPVPNTPYLHEALERMARDIHAAVYGVGTEV